MYALIATRMIGIMCTARNAILRLQGVSEMHVQCNNCNNKKWVATDAITTEEILNTLRFCDENIKCCENPMYIRIPSKVE
jgi:hypothetical protein